MFHYLGKKGGRMRKVIGLLGCGVLLAIFCEGAVFFYQEPEQYVMAQAKPTTAVKPVLDISGLKEIQSIPVGEMRFYWARDLVDEGEVPMEQILDSIANLAIMQMGLEKFTLASSNPGEVIVGGEFGRVLKEILGFDPEREFDMSVEHTDFIQTPGATPECDEDHYLLTINCRQIEVILYRDYGSPDKGLDWGIGGLLLTENSKTEFAPNGVPHVEERELAINRDKITGKFYAYYTVRIIKYNDGKLLKWKQWKFVEGNPNPVWVGGSGS